MRCTTRLYKAAGPCYRPSQGGRVATTTKDRAPNIVCVVPLAGQSHNSAETRVRLDSKFGVRTLRALRHSVRTKGQEQNRQKYNIPLLPFTGGRTSSRERPFRIAPLCAFRRCAFFFVVLFLFAFVVLPSAVAQRKDVAPAARSLQRPTGWTGTRARPEISSSHTPI